MNKPLGNIVILVLSFYVLVVMAIETIFVLPQETSKLLQYIDNLVCLVFLGDFFLRLYSAPSKPEFLKWGWIDFVSSIPNLDVLRWGRAIRVVRIFRVLRAIRSTKKLSEYLMENQAKSAITTLALFAVLLMIGSSIGILNVEQASNSNIASASDALWWSFVTITTVGYGDFYPVTSWGRIIAAILMTYGIGLFGAFTAYFASFFVAADNRVLNEVRELKQEVQDLKDKL